MIDHGRAPVPLHILVRFIPRWRLRRFLMPMNDRGLIAPLAQTMHSSLVCSRKHERPHGVLVLPNGSRPESIPSIAKKPDGETAFFRLCLPSRTKPLDKEGRKVLPRTHAQTGDGNKGHVVATRTSGQQLNR
jgi:hypothetical protein